MILQDGVSAFRFIHWLIGQFIHPFNFPLIHLFIATHLVNLVVAKVEDEMDLVTVDLVLPDDVFGVVMNGKTWNACWQWPSLQRETQRF